LIKFQSRLENSDLSGSL